MGPEPAPPNARRAPYNTGGPALERRASLSLRSPRSRQTLIEAARSRHHDLPRYYLKRGLEGNVPRTRGRTDAPPVANRSQNGGESRGSADSLTDAAVRLRPRQLEFLQQDTRSANGFSETLGLLGKVAA